MDRGWWDLYLNQVNAEFIGDKFTTDKNLEKLGINHVNINSYGNSGAAAIAFAIYSGAKNIILLGYDCQRTNNKAHWHGDHPSSLGNAKKIDKWHEKFSQLASYVNENLPEVRIINATRETAIDVFEKIDLEKALC